MSVETISAPDRSTVDAMDEALHGMMARLRAILAEPAMTQDYLVEIISIYNNVAYIFLYLEANEQHVNYERLLPWRDRFHKDPALDERMVALLEDLRCDDPEAEDSRVRLLRQLRHKAQAPDPAAGERAAELVARAKEVLREVQQDQHDLLRRLGIDIGPASPAAAFYRLTSGLADSAKRAKLTAAWATLRDRKQDAMVSAVDAIIDEQRRQSKDNDFPTVLAQTLEKCGVGETTIESFLDRYLARTLERHDLLAAEVAEATGAETYPMDHFGFYMRKVFGDAKVPQFPLDDCLDYVFDVAKSVFDLDVRRVSGAGDQVLTTTVSAGSEEVGRIHFDLWDTEHKTLKANTTTGIRNRTDWSGLVQHPVAYVSCRFRRDDDGIQRITFQNVHSLCHEFGHAINHVLIRKRISNQSGLEYLPLERLENLSMWFEKWVFHAEFARHLDLSAEEAEGLVLCQRIKKTEYRGTYLDRAVTAALDFDIHRHPEGGVAESFGRLDDRYGIATRCRLGDFLGYFTWPMLQANPGAYFSYLWGAAESGEKFEGFRNLTLAECAAQPGLRDRFASCFDFDAPSSEPDVTSVFDFYDAVRREGR